MTNFDRKFREYVDDLRGGLSSGDFIKSLPDTGFAPLNVRADPAQGRRVYDPNTVLGKATPDRYQVDEKGTPVAIRNGLVQRVVDFFKSLLVYIIGGLFVILGIYVLVVRG